MFIHSFRPKYSNNFMGQKLPSHQRYQSCGDFSGCFLISGFSFTNLPLPSTFSWKKRSSHQWKIVSKPPLSCLLGMWRVCKWVIPLGWGTICAGVNCYIRKCTICMYYPWLWLLINIVVISYWRWRDWFHSNLKSNCECALVINDNRWVHLRM